MSLTPSESAVLERMDREFGATESDLQMILTVARMSEKPGHHAVEMAASAWLIARSDLGRDDKYTRSYLPWRKPQYAVHEYQTTDGGTMPVLQRKPDDADATGQGRPPCALPHRWIHTAILVTGKKDEDARRDQYTCEMCGEQYTTQNSNMQYLYDTGTIIRG